MYLRRQQLALLLLLLLVVVVVVVVVVHTFLNASRFTMFSVARKSSVSARCATAGKCDMQ